MKSKICTTIEQSRKLLELGVDVNTADMCYPYDRHLDKMYGDIPYVMGYKRFNESTDIPAWSLSALLSIIEREYHLTLFHDGVAWNINVISHDSNLTNHHYNADGNTPLDACAEMIVKLKEKGRL